MMSQSLLVQVVSQICGGSRSILIRGAINFAYPVHIYLIDILKVIYLSNIYISMESNRRDCFNGQ
jgi:hypothetical protein